jgi:hypothetical protein
MRLPTLTGLFLPELAKTLVAHGIICLSAWPTASRFGEGNDLHHHGQPVVDARKFASPTSRLGQRFPFLFVAQWQRRTSPQQTKLRIQPARI